MVMISLAMLTPYMLLALLYFAYNHIITISSCLQFNRLHIDTTVVVYSAHRSKESIEMMSVYIHRVVIATLPHS